MMMNAGVKKSQRIEIKVKVDKMQQNSKCRLYDDKDEMINHILIKCSKQGQKEYKTRHVWGGGRWSTGNCARIWNLTILPNGTCTNQNLSEKMRHTKVSGILRYKKKEKWKEKKTCQIVAVCVLLCTNIFGKGMDPSFLLFQLWVNSRID